MELALTPVTTHPGAHSPRCPLTLVPNRGSRIPPAAERIKAYRSTTRKEKEAGN